MSRTKNVLKIVISSSINQVVIVLAGLIMPPLLIANYGSETNGLINSVKQMLNYFTVVSVGLGAASQVALYKPLTEGNWPLINKIMATLSRFLNKAGLVFLACIGVFAFILPVIRRDNLDFMTIAGIVLICGIGSLIEFVFLTRYKILLTADQKQYIVSNVYTQGTVINTVLSVILIILRASILWVQLAATFAYLVRMLLLVRQVHGLYPSLNLHVVPDKSAIGNSKEAFLYKFSDILINYIPMTFVTFICGYTDASIYTVYNLVFSAIVMIVNIFSTGLSPSFGNQIVQKDYEGFKNSFKGYNFAFRTISFFCYICSAVLIVPFVSVYIQNTDGVNYLLPAVGASFAINGIMRALRTTYITLVDAVGNYKDNIKDSYLEVILNIAISLVFTLKFGLIGVLIGGSISAIIRSLQFLFSIHKTVLKASPGKELLTILINFIVGAVIYYFFYGITVDGYISLIISAIVVAAVTGCVLMVINFLLDRTGFMELYRRMKGLIKK